MPNATPLTFQQTLKKNLKRVATYWAPLSVVFAGFGTLLGFYTLSTYATSIGRPDLMAAALEAKSALIPWLAAVMGMLSAYLLILLSTTVLFGLTVSLFNDIPSQQHKLTGVLLVPILVGIVGLLWQNFKGPDLDDWGKLIWMLIWLAVSLLVLLLIPMFRVAVDTCATMASPRNPRSGSLRCWFMLMVALLLLATVIGAVFPASLILQAYTGEDTPEALSRLMIISMFAATVALLPVVVFYVSKADLFKRLSLGLLMMLVSGGVVIAISPGSPAAIVYSAALMMEARTSVEARYMLTTEYATEDFDTAIWGSVETVRGKPEVSAFPLFSFGNVLLLCPTSLVKTSRKEWPQHSAYCVLTQASSSIRRPKKSDPATGPIPGVDSSTDHKAQ